MAASNQQVFGVPLNSEEDLRRFLQLNKHQYEQFSSRVIAHIKFKGLHDQRHIGDYPSHLVKTELVKIARADPVTSQDAERSWIILYRLLEFTLHQLNDLAFRGTSQVSDGMLPLAMQNGTFAEPKPKTQPPSLLHPARARRHALASRVARTLALATPGAGYPTPPLSRFVIGGNLPIPPPPLTRCPQQSSGDETEDDEDEEERQTVAAFPHTVLSRPPRTNYRVRVSPLHPEYYLRDPAHPELVPFGWRSVSMNGLQAATPPYQPLWASLHALLAVETPVDANSAFGGAVRGAIALRSVRDQDSFLRWIIAALEAAPGQFELKLYFWRE